jgi:hypothetical protein
MHLSHQVKKMPSASTEEGLTVVNADAGAVRSPAAFAGMLLARSFGLAAGVALMFLLAAALFATQ